MVNILRLLYGLAAGGSIAGAGCAGDVADLAGSDVGDGGGDGCGVIEAVVANVQVEGVVDLLLCLRGGLGEPVREVGDLIQ